MSTTTRATLDQQRFAEEMARFQKRSTGRIGVMVHDFASGQDLRWNADDAFPTASTMKIPLLYALYRLAQDGEIDLAERIPLRREERVPGSGVLQHFDEGLRPTVRDLAEMMIIVSDNYATDLLYGMVGRERLASILAEVGLTHTHLPHTTWQILAHVGGIDPADTALTYDDLRDRLKGSASDDPEAPYTDDDYDRSTPADMVRLMTLIEEGHGLTPENREAIIDILKHQNFNDRIPGRLPDDAAIEVAHKTGSVRGVRNDVGIVYAPGVRYAIAVMSRNLADPVEGVDQIARLSRWAWDKFTASRHQD